MTPYDIRAAIDTLFPGIVVERPLMDAAYAAWVSGGNVPLTASNVTAILTAANVLNAATVVADYVPTTMPNYPTTLPSYPTGLPRFPDDLGGMVTPDGWSIIADGKVVQGIGG